MSYTSKKILELSNKHLLSHISLFAVFASNFYWKPYKHLVFLSEKIQNVLTSKDTKKVIFCLPPRHGKTELLIYSIAWFMKIASNKSIIYCTYGESLSLEKSRKIRDVYNYVNNALHIKPAIPKNSSSIKSFKTENNNFFIATGIGGPITGKGADVLIIDDPYKNHEQALSATYREKVLNYYKWVLRTRLQNQAKIILIQTRWHENDLAGILPEIEKDFETIKIPAICERENDILKRKVGDVIETKMFSKEDILKTKQVLGEKIFNALYQQEPITSEGLMFKPQDFNYFKIENEYIITKDKKAFLRDCIIFAVIDTATTKNKTSDYFVLMSIAVDNKKNIYILDIYRDKIEFTSHEKLVENMSKIYKYSFIAIEKAFVGYSLIQLLQDKGYKIKSLEARKNKILRAQSALVFYENQKIYHLENAKWLVNYENELLQFPSAEHDDQVDCISYACEIVSDKTFILDEDIKSLDFTNKKIKI